MVLDNTGFVRLEEMDSTGLPRVNHWRERGLRIVAFVTHVSEEVLSGTVED